MNEPARSMSYRYPDYLAEERASATKHEFLNGEIFAMTGGSLEHGRLASSMTIEIGSQLRGRPCTTFSSDVRVRVLATGLTTYPDLSVVCGSVERDPEDTNTLVNPILLVEVLSDSTEGYDRGEKFAHYRRIPSLKEYVLVSQHTPRIEVFRRNDDGTWTLDVAEPKDRVKLTSVGCELSVDAVFASALAS